MRSYNCAVIDIIIERTTTTRYTYVCIWKTEKIVTVSFKSTVGSLMIVQGKFFQKSNILGHRRGSHLKTRFFRSVYVSFLSHKNGEFLLKTYT